MAKRGLGRGIDALMNAQKIQEPTDSGEASGSGVEKVSLSKLKPNPYQPRTHFSEESLAELAESIQTRGVIQPILVELDGEGEYTIIAGERRFRAAQQAGLEEIPVILQSFSAEEKREIALVENIQRENLSPIDEATAYRDIMESANIGQDELAKRVGKNRSTVANALRLLKLPDAAREAVASGRVSSGHARALLSVTDAARSQQLLSEILEEGLSVRAAEKRARELSGSSDGEASPETLGGPGAVDPSGEGATVDPADPRESGSGEGAGSRAPKKSAEMRELEDRLIEKLGTKVSITGTNERGRIEISYHSVEDLEGLYRTLAGEEAPST